MFDIGDRYRDMLTNRKLSGLEPGLIKIVYSFRDVPQEELVLILTPSLADGVCLPNDVLCYRDFLRSGMKNSLLRGLKISGPFSGGIIRDDYITEVKGRTVQLNDSFGNPEKNFIPLLIACNNQYFHDAIDEMTRALNDAGFNVNSSRWEDYKNWETGKLKTFNT